METGGQTAGTKLSDAVAKEIRVLLVRRDMKQTDLAVLMDVSEMWVSRRLRGAQPIDLNDLQRFADALNVEVHELLPRSDTPRQNEGRVLTTVGTTEARADRANQGLHRRHPRPNHNAERPIGIRVAHTNRTNDRPPTEATAPSPATPPMHRRAALVRRAG